MVVAACGIRVVCAGHVVAADGASKRNGANIVRRLDLAEVDGAAGDRAADRAVVDAPVRDGDPAADGGAVEHGEDDGEVALAPTLAGVGALPGSRYGVGARRRAGGLCARRGGHRRRSAAAWQGWTSGDGGVCRVVMAGAGGGVGDGGGGDDGGGGGDGEEAGSQQPGSGRAPCGGTVRGWRGGRWPGRCVHGVARLGSGGVSGSDEVADAGVRWAKWGGGSVSGYGGARAGAALDE